MTPDSQPSSAQRLLAILRGIEDELARGDLEPEQLNNVKSAIDDVRSRLWAAMSAASDGDPASVQEFWLRRAAEVCQKMAGDLEEGVVDPRRRHGSDLRAASTRLQSVLKATDPA